MKNVVKKPWQRIVNCFLAGVIAILPLVITILVVAWVTDLLNKLVGPETFLGDKLGIVGSNFVGNQTLAYIIGWGVVLAGIFLLGVFVQSGLKRLYEGIMNGVIRRVPLVGKLYDTSRQLVDMMDHQGDDKLKGMSVVFCFFGHESGAGVLALLPTPKTVSVNGRDHHVVLVPQSPVPIGGGLLFVPVEFVEHVDMSVDSMMGVYVSMGVTVPELMGVKKKAE
jgi:uncharacterized membrane protein